MLLPIPVAEIVRETPDHLRLSLSVKGKSCGQLLLSAKGLQFHLACRLRIGKGWIELDKVQLSYASSRCSVRVEQRELLLARCEPATFEKLHGLLKHWQAQPRPSPSELKRREFWREEH